MYILYIYDMLGEIGFAPYEKKNFKIIYQI